MHIISLHLSEMISNTQTRQMYTIYSNNNMKTSTIHSEDIYQHPKYRAQLYSINVCIYPYILVNNHHVAMQTTEDRIVTTIK